ncbi:MAG TPA: DUF4331 family protein [Candidatus Limnocylindria bacterium]|jgi:hypothetical protein
MRTLTLRAVSAALIVVLAAAAMVIGSNALRVDAADHLDAPTVKKDGRIDINDVYVFQGSNASKTVLVMTVNPAAGILSPTTFRQGASYDFMIDTSGDAIEDFRYQVKFEGVRRNGAQKYAVYRRGHGDRDTLVRGAWTGTNTALAGGGKAFAGLADDPFFFDLARFNTFKATLLGGGGLGDLGGLVDCTRTNPAPTNFFNGLNGSAIVLEVPDSALGGGTVKVWARTTIKENGMRTQVERMGLPTINTVFNHTDATKDAYNRALPRNDVADYSDDVSGVVELITTLAGTAPDPAAYGDAIAGALLPDVITYDTTQPANFAMLNGRALADDVIDVALTVVANTPLSDCVANDSALRSSFPYVGLPN